LHICSEYQADKNRYSPAPSCGKKIGLGIRPSPLNFVAPRDGLEPPTKWLTVPSIPFIRRKQEKAKVFSSQFFQLVNSCAIVQEKARSSSKNEVNIHLYIHLKMTPGSPFSGSFGWEQYRRW
jgi:hypothetical protein